MKNIHIVTHNKQVLYWIAAEYLPKDTYVMNIISNIYKEINKIRQEYSINTTIQ